MDEADHAVAPVGNRHMRKLGQPEAGPDGLPGHRYEPRVPALTASQLLQQITHPPGFGRRRDHRLAGVLKLAGDEELLRGMRLRAREFAVCRYWHRIFGQVYETYNYCLMTNSSPLLRQPTPNVGRTFA